MEHQLEARHAHPELSRRMFVAVSVHVRHQDGDLVLEPCQADDAMDEETKLLVALRNHERQIRSRLQRGFRVDDGRPQPHEPEAVLRAEVIDDEMARDREQPARKTFDFAGAALFVGQQHSLLRDVGGVIGILHSSPNESPERGYDLWRYADPLPVDDANDVDPTDRVSRLSLRNDADSSCVSCAVIVRHRLADVRDIVLPPA